MMSVIIEIGYMLLYVPVYVQSKGAKGQICSSSTLLFWMLVPVWKGIGWIVTSVLVWHSTGERELVWQDIIVIG